MAELRVELEAIRRNTTAVADLVRPRGLDLIAVTKGCLGDVRVAKAMQDGGAVALADTRDANLRRLRAAFPQVPLHRIYLPPVHPSSTFEPGDVTYVSSWAGAEAVGRLGSAERPQRVMIQVETGDRREGVPLSELEKLAALIDIDPRLQLEGLATNYACFEGTPEGILDSVENLAAAARRLRAGGLPVPRVSGGNSSLLFSAVSGRPFPAEITELRCGESLLLGQDALYYRPLPGCRQDACIVRAEVLEGYTKTVRGEGERRLVLGLGRQDLGSGSVRFVSAGLHECGRSSDYLVVGLEAGFALGGDPSFVDMIPSYTALVAAWTSPYVEVRVG